MGELVVKDNALLDASHQLSEVEQRLILLAIVKGREYCDSIEGLENYELEIHADDYIKVFGVQRQTAYESLKKAVLGLFEAKWGYKYVTSKGKKAVRYERFIQTAEYIEGESIVKLRFSHAIIPFLVQLEKNFTSYEMKQVADLSSRYAMRLYEFLMRFKDSKVLKISLEDLRFRFGLVDEYKAMGDFKKFVLDQSIEQINKNTDIEVKYTQQKKGRVITGFTFSYKYKKVKKILPKLDYDGNIVEHEIKLLSPKQADYFANLLSNDNAFGGKYASTSESTKVFANRISQDLQRDIEKVKLYMPALIKAGFKADNAIKSENSK